MRAKTVVGIEQAARGNGHKPQSARRNAAQWARIIEAQRQSPVTVVEFCRRRGIAKATFWYWRKRLVSAAQNDSGAKPVQRFLAVPIVAPVAEPIEVSVDTMQVRLAGAAAARVVEAIVGRIGRGKRWLDALDARKIAHGVLPNGALEPLLFGNGLVLAVLDVLVGPFLVERCVVFPRPGLGFLLCHRTTSCSEIGADFAASARCRTFGLWSSTIFPG